MPAWVVRGGRVDAGFRPVRFLIFLASRRRWEKCCTALPFVELSEPPARVELAASGLEDHGPIRRGGMDVPGKEQPPRRGTLSAVRAAGLRTEGPCRRTPCRCLARLTGGSARTRVALRDHQGPV